MPAPQERTSLNVSAERAVLAAVQLPQSDFDPEDPLGELRSLAQTAGAVVVGEITQRMERLVAATAMGTGKVQELKAVCDELDAGLVVFDHGLSPSQIGNLEKAVGRKILDRSELILDIFASRATTRQAQLQVEIAQLAYTYPRLRAMWGHLERLGGGIGTRGPGEQQLETDRRLVQRRRKQLQTELDEIQGRKRREVRKRRGDHFTVGLVGYTNAGKSTLFNTVTDGGAYADDRLFATLTTRTRTWDLGGGLGVMLSDTVGFVRDLPHDLVASFRATLEEATHADLLLVVLDAADPAAELHHRTVMRTLDELFEDVRNTEPDWREPRRLLVLNKADKLRDNAELLLWTRQHPDAVAVCATDEKNTGLTQLAAVVRGAVVGDVRELLLTLPLAEAKAIDTIEKRAEILDRAYENGSVTFRARIGSRQVDELRAGGADLTAQAPED